MAGHEKSSVEPDMITERDPVYEARADFLSVRSEKSFPV